MRNFFVLTDISNFHEISRLKNFEKIMHHLDSDFTTVVGARDSINLNKQEAYQMFKITGCRSSEDVLIRYKLNRSHFSKSCFDVFDQTERVMIFLKELKKFSDEAEYLHKAAFLFR